MFNQNLNQKNSSPRSRSPKLKVTIASKDPFVIKSPPKPIKQQNLLTERRGKAKIKVFSPNKNGNKNPFIHQDKANHNRHSSDFTSSHPIRIQADVRFNNKSQEASITSETSNLSIKYHFQPFRKDQQNQLPINHMNSNAKKNFSQKIFINSKPFDINSIKSQVIYVNPMKNTHHITNKFKFNEKIQHDKNHKLNVPSIIQQQAEPQSMGQSQKSLIKGQQNISIPQEHSDQENKGLQQKQYISCIEENNGQKILNLQNLPLYQSRVESQKKITASLPSQKTLINELQFQTNQKISLSWKKKDEASVQTSRFMVKEQSSTYRSNTNRSNFAITKNLQYAIQLKIHHNQLQMPQQLSEQATNLQNNEVKQNQQLLSPQKQVVQNVEVKGFQKEESNLNLKSQYYPQQQSIQNVPKELTHEDIQQKSLKDNLKISIQIQKLELVSNKLQQTQRQISFQSISPPQKKNMFYSNRIMYENKQKYSNKIISKRSINNSIYL